MREALGHSTCLFGHMQGFLGHRNWVVTVSSKPRNPTKWLHRPTDLRAPAPGVALTTRSLGTGRYPRYPSPRSPRLRHSRDVLSTAASWALPLHDASVLVPRQPSGGSTSQKKSFSRLGAGRESLRYCSFTIPHPPYQTNSTYFFAVPPLGDLVPWRVVALVAALLWRLSGGKTEMSLESRSRSLSFMIQARPGGAPYISQPCHLSRTGLNFKA